MSGGELVEQADRVLASVAGEVAVVAVDHGQAGAHVAGELEGGDAGTQGEGRECVPEIVDAAEGLDPDRLESEARAGVRYVGSDTTRVVCLPTCHNARRITPPHRVPFRSMRQATAAGYRPCQVCRSSSGAIAA